MDGEIEDADLSPVVIVAVQGCPKLEPLRISHRESLRDPADFGYSKTIWGVLT